MKIIKFLPILLIAFLFYRFFASTSPFVAHDFPLLFRDSRNFFPFWAISWDYMGAGGLGASALKTMWIDLYANFVYFISNWVNIPWFLSQRIFWIVPFLLISIYSSHKFSGLFVREPIYRILSAIIYTFNTYILLIVGGGQFGIALSYGLAPLVLFWLFKLFKDANINSLLISSLLSGVLIALDPRIAFLIFGIALLWYLFMVRDFSYSKLKYVFLNFIIAGFLNSYWIVPTLLYLLTNTSPSVSNYFSLPGVKFLSFATFENSMSFLHPNWPENIFGKIYFQRPEFLLLPILAFASLLFKVKKELLFFAILGLVGIFLGKGANEPFGQSYIFLFQNIPGFNLFRDPTKFYLLIGISYSVLIPFSVYSIQNWLISKIKYQKLKIQSKYQIFNTSNAFLLFTILYLLFLLRPAWSGELTGIFKPKQLPNEYVKLIDYLSEDKDFSRTLWVPRRQKYGFFAPNHPAADSEILFAKRDIGSVSEKELSDLSVKYVIVPYDSDGEIFLKDRKYDEKQRERTIRKVERIGLNSVLGFGNIAIYQTQTNKDHFWCDCDAAINYKFVNPAQYIVSVRNAKKGDVLIFSEGYDKNWIAESSSIRQAQDKKFKVESEKFGKVNSFTLPRDGNYDLKVKYKPQEWVNMGLIMSGLSLFSLIFGLLALYYRHGRTGGRTIIRIRG